MKYQDSSSDENLVSSEDRIFTFHMWRYHGCHDYFSLSQLEIPITPSRAFTTFSFTNQSSWKTRWIFKSTPNFDINIFDDVQNEGIDGRFVPMTDSEVDNLTETGETDNTKRKILYDINFVKQFLIEHGERRSIEEITAVDLNNYLSKFIFAARTKKDEKREPSSYRGILSSVECHLRRACYAGKSIIKDNDFQKTRQTPLKQNRKNWSDKGRAINPKQPQLEATNRSIFFLSKRVLELSSPQALVSTVWLNNTLHFRLRGCKEQRELRWADVVLKSVGEGKQYLEYSG